MRLREKLAVFLLFAILSLVLFWPIFLGKVNLNGNLLVSFYPIYGENLPFKNTGWDQLRIYFPFYKFTFDSFRNLQLPFWNPYAFSGHPHAADFQSGVFYPLNIFGLLLPQIEFWHLLRITPTLLASFFTFLYLRNLKLSSLAAFFGAMTFGFSPYILTWGEEVVLSTHSIIWLPLILFAVDRFISSKKSIFLSVIAFSTAFSFFGGYMQTSIYLFIFVGFYLAFRFREKHIRTHRIFIMIAFFLGAGISALQLLPSAELFFNGARSEIKLTETLFNFLLPPESLVTYLVPDFFGNPATWNTFRQGSAQYYEGILFVGVSALIFALYTVIRRIKDGFVMFLLVFALVSVSTTFDLPTSKLLLKLPIPFLSSSIPNRILFLGAFCLSVLSAMGVDLYLKEKSKKVILAITRIGFFYALIGFYLVAVLKLNLPFFAESSKAMTSLRNLLIPLSVFGVSAILLIIGTRFEKFKSLMILGVICLSFAHIFYFSQKYFSFSDRKFVFPDGNLLGFINENQGTFRIWGVGDAYLETNFATQYDIYFPEGYDSLNNRAYAEFTYAMQGKPLSDFEFRADAGLGRGKTLEFLENDGRLRLTNLLGIKYVISASADEEILKEKGFRDVFTNGRQTIFENQSVLPRAFLASEADVVSETERGQIPTLLLSEGFNLKDKVILEKNPEFLPSLGKGSADIITYSAQKVVIETQAAVPKILFLSDNYYPGWKVKVDGKNSELLRADYTFRAVALDRGKHLVEFYFDSNTVRVGFLITLVSFGALVFLWRSKIPT